LGCGFAALLNSYTVATWGASDNGEVPITETGRECNSLPQLKKVGNAIPSHSLNRSGMQFPPTA
jgi:hypothetical protein